MIDDAHIAALFGALSSPPRVRVFRILLAHARRQLAFGQLVKASGIPASTLTHHLGEMEKGGILVRHREGRQTLIGLRLDRLQSTLTGLLDECCAAAPLQGNPE